MATTKNTHIARSINGMACDITVLISINSLYIRKMVSLELVRSRYPYFSIDSSRSCVVACIHREFAESMCVSHESSCNVAECTTRRKCVSNWPHEPSNSTVTSRHRVFATVAAAFKPRNSNNLARCAGSRSNCAKSSMT
jgi:hypothetical protein